MAADTSALPVDADSAASLAARGLRMAAVDPADDGAVRAWLEADTRGFHDAAPSPEFFAQVRGDFALQRTIGVYDDTLVDAAVPVATVAGWRTPVTLPGGEAQAWAISSVTVAPTHRRRGIARAMLEGELRTAVASGLPLAVLTVSEATIYGRYGFGPATWSANFEVDARRAGWVGGDVSGRVQLVGRETAMAVAHDVFEHIRRATPGEVEIAGSRFDRLFGQTSDPAELRKRRFVRYDDEQGRPRGIAIYHVSVNADDYSSHTVDVDHLAAASDDAYRALWRYLLELDLVGTVKASLRSTDEPLRWLVRDPRQIRTTEIREHLWARVLDPVATLTARTYAGPGALALRVSDPLGFAQGSFTVVADAEGRAEVSPTPDPDAAVPLLEVPVDVLGSLLLGGVSAVTLAAAGRLGERELGDAAKADRLLRGIRPPLLSTWF